eukprot:2996710-Ditylum_brightwellii.AAC.1
MMTTARTTNATKTKAAPQWNILRHKTKHRISPWGNTPLVKFPGGTSPVEPPGDTEAHGSLKIRASRSITSTAKAPKHFKKSIDAVATLQMTTLSEVNPVMSNFTPTKCIKLKGASVTKQSTG